MASATSYIKEVEKQVAVSKIDENNQIADGIYEVAELTTVKMKGFAPTNGRVTVENGVVVEAKLYVDGYSIDYDGKETKEAINNYGGTDIILNINGQELKQELAPTVEFTNIEVSDSTGTNIVCNNGAQIRLEDSKAIVTNALGNTTCKANASLKDTIDNLDTTENYILMLSDEAVNEELLIEVGYNVSLNLNEKTLSREGSASGEFIFRVRGDMEINGTGGTMGGTGSSIITGSYSNLVINGGTYNYIQTYGKVAAKNSIHKCTDNKKNCYPIRSYGKVTSTYDNIQVVDSLGKAFGVLDTSNVIIKNSKLGCTADNCIYFHSEGSLTLNNVEINAYGYAVKNNSANGVIEIIDSTITAAASGSSSSGVEQYATGDKAAINIKNSTIESYNPSVYLTGSGDINIYNSNLHSSGSGVDNIYINENATTTSYINIFESNIDSDGNHGVKNDGLSNVSIYNSNVTAAASAVVNSLTGIVNINEGTYTVDGAGYQGAISNRSTGTINICAGKINGLENKYDLYNVSTGYINYSSNVTLKNNKIYDTNDSSHTVLNDSITCK